MTLEDEGVVSEGLVKVEYSESVVPVGVILGVAGLSRNYHWR